MSAAATAATRPRPPALPRPARVALRATHVVLAVGWTGLSVVMLTLPLALLIGGTGSQAGFVLDVAAFVGTQVIPYFAVGTVLTGVAAGLGTPWGLIRHRWVVAKTVLALGVIVSSVTLSIGWMDAARASPEPDLLVALAGMSALHQLALLTSMVLSVDKPGGRTRWGRARRLTGNQMVA